MWLSPFLLYHMTIESAPILCFLFDFRMLFPTPHPPGKHLKNRTFAFFVNPVL